MNKVHVHLITKSDIDADFVPTQHCGVLYVSEAVILRGVEELIPKFAALKKYERTIVLVHRSSLTEQYFQDIQTEAVIKKGLFVIPVSNEGDAVRLLIKLMKQGRMPKPQSRRVTIPTNAYLNTVSTIPSISNVRAQRILSHFDSLFHLANAPLEELEKVDKMGKKNSNTVFSFFRTPFHED